MKNTKSTILGIAFSTVLAMPVAMAQDSHANAHAQDHANSNAQHDNHDNMSMPEMPRTPAVPATPATPAVPHDNVMGDPAPAEPAVPATPAQPASGKLTWAELDTDGDGMLSATEAAGIGTLGDGFEDADADADGLLTAGEYRDWFEQQQSMDDTDNPDDADD